MSIKMVFATLDSICFGILNLWVICLCICLHASEPSNTFLVNMTGTDAQKKEVVILQLPASAKTIEYGGVFCNSLEACGRNDAPLKVHLEEYADQQKISATIKALFELAEDSSYQVPKSCTEDTALMEVAEKLDASSALRNTISKISFTNQVYDTLHAIALHKSAPRKSHSRLEPATAQRWLLACIPNFSDTQKTELRKKLYPLQYQSAEFLTLREQVINLLKKWKADAKFELPKLDTLEDFKNWQTSFLHQAYCAARPLNALSSAKFQEIKQQLEFNVYQEYLHFSEKEASCVQCNKNVSLNSAPPVGFACYSCMEKTVNNKLVDLCDCYTLDNTVLSTFVKVHGGCLGGGPLLPAWLKHLPQIHLPLLELLIHYRNISYYQGDGGWHCSVSRVNFGINVVDLDPVDIKALSMFQVEPCWDYRDHLICTLKINSKKNVSTLKSELRRLRKLGNFCIKFIADDADAPDAYNPNNDGFHWRENNYSSVWVNNWFLRAIIGAAGLYCIAKLASSVAQRAQVAYDIKFNAYNARLQEHLATVPEHIQSVTGYLAKTKDPIYLNLPSEVEMPALKGDPHNITLFDIKQAQKTAYALNQIAHPTYPGGFWYYSSWITGSLFVIGALLRNCFALNFPIITACRIAIVKPYQAPRG